MKQMAYKDGILYGISPDGKTLYRSVSGRPLDFVIAVDKNGNKAGAADKVAHAIGFDHITCLHTLPSGELLVATVNQFSPLTINYSKTYFGEPTFINNKAFPVGVVNQFSLLLSYKDNGYTDTYFVDIDGMRSFNAAALDRNEGRNSVFAAKIDDVLADKQVITCAINFQDYSIFSIKTIYSEDNLVAVFDNKLNCWVCFDDYGIGTIKQFALATQGTSPRLYAITTDDKLYQLFASEEVLQSTVSLPAVTTGRASMQIKLSKTFAVMVGGTEIGEINATSYANGLSNGVVTKPIANILTDNILFNFDYSGKQCWRSQIVLSWNTNAKLAMVESFYIGQSQTPLTDSAKRYGLT
jgi:hypothetical protein